MKQFWKTRTVERIAESAWYRVRADALDREAIPHRVFGATDFIRAACYDGGPKLSLDEAGKLLDACPSVVALDDGRYHVLPTGVRRKGSA